MLVWITDWLQRHASATVVADMWEMWHSDPDPLLAMKEHGVKVF
jgi:hypothetical protein